MQPQDFIMMPIPADRYTAVCALLGGAALAAVAASAPTPGNAGTSDAAPSGAAEQSGSGAAASPAVATSDTGNAPVPTATGDSGEVDAHGHPWSAELHASTKGQTKDGLWRMKVGVSRPDPLPGFPVEGGASSTDTGTAANGTASEAGASASTETAASTVGEEDDEFAAFRTAAAASDAGDAAAAASVPARSWADADLGALCNQAAVKLGDPTPVKELIGQYVPAGEVAHSRNIPADKREEFAKAVEAKAGIEFAG